MLKRLHLATSGLFGKITPLFLCAIEFTGTRSAVPEKYLAQAYQVFQSEDEIGCNPFEATMATVEMNLKTPGTSSSKEAAQ